MIIRCNAIVEEGGFIISDVCCRMRFGASGGGLIRSKALNLDGASLDDGR